MSESVGAVHLGWDVVAVAAGGGGKPTTLLMVDGQATPPAQLLADASGQLHTSGVDGGRRDIGPAIADVRDLLGHSRIVVAGATWPVDAVFGARFHNPVAAIRAYLGGTPDVLALPYPDSWSEQLVDSYAEVVESIGIAVEPIPESVALAGYVRERAMVDNEIGATIVYSDGRSLLVVAVHADESRPTESVDVALPRDAHNDSRTADSVVDDVVAAARDIDADARQIVLIGNIVDIERLRFAFQNHFGRRLVVAAEPLHAIAIGAAALVAGASDASEDSSTVAMPEPSRAFGAPSPADHGVTVRHVAASHRQPSVWDDSGPARMVEPVVNGVRAHAVTLIVAGAAIVALIVAFLAFRWLTEPEPLSAEDARAAVVAAMLPSDEFDGMAARKIEDDVVAVTTGAELTSMACGSIPLTAKEATGARVSAEQSFEAPQDSPADGDGYRAGDALALRAMYYDPDTAESVMSAILGRVQDCPNGAANDLRYVVAVPSNGEDPGPPLQAGSTPERQKPSLDAHGGDRLAWRGLLPRADSTIGRVQHVTCLADRTGDIVLRACGTSLDTRRADDLAELGISRLLERTG